MNTTAFTLGFHALFAQALALREIGLLFSAGELSVSAGLSAWLLWTAAGIALARRPSLPFWTALFAAASPAALALCRAAALPLTVGTPPGLFGTVLLGALLTLPFGLLNGAAIAAGLKALTPQRFYLLESCGAAAGGLAAALLFAGAPGTDYVAACSVTAAAAIFLSLRAAGYSRRGAAAGTGRLSPQSVSRALRVTALLFIPLALFSAWAGRRVYPALYDRGEVKEVFQSRETRLVFVEREGALTVHADGVALGEAPAGEAGEIPVHIPLLLRPSPKSVLLMGPAAPLYAVEAARHSPAELFAGSDDEPAAARLLERSGGQATLCRARDCLSRAAAYDAVIVPAGDPANSGLNRYYTAEFMEAVKATLKPGGIAAFAFSSAENYLSPPEAYAAACLRATARSVFPHVEVIPGGRALLLASADEIKLDPGLLGKRLRSRGIKTRTVTGETLPFILHPYKRAWYASRLDAAGDTPVNSALRPLAYFLSWKVWVSMYAGPDQFLGLAALLIALAWGSRRLAAGLKGSASRGLMAGAFLAGAWGMAFEICLMLAWEARLGTMASSLGLIFTLFLGGMAAGAAAFRRRGGVALSAGLMAAVSAAAAVWLPGAFASQGQTSFAVACSLLLAAGGFAAGSY
ncbi:MAG: spermidine synthase, partial [Elusimicrobia bacterium]